MMVDAYINVEVENGVRMELATGRDAPSAVWLAGYLQH